jgi:ribonuclease G
VWLNSGAYIVFDITEALVAIDVNTGKYVGKKNLPETILKTNIEAAREITRQLRIRDIGGIIIIDFIDMQSKDDQESLMKVMEEELGKDRTKTSLLGITRLGLVEMTRKKVREGLGNFIQKECPYCQGSGRVLSENTMALKVIREIEELLAKEKFSAILVKVHPRVAAVIIGTGGERLSEAEEEMGIDIYLIGDNELHIEEFVVINKGSKEELRKKSLPLELGEEIKITIEEKHYNNHEDGIARLMGYIIIVNRAGNMVGKKIKIRITELHRTFARAEIS